MFHLNNNIQQKKAGENSLEVLYKIRPLRQKLTDYHNESATIHEGMCPLRGGLASEFSCLRSPTSMARRYSFSLIQGLEF
jgi:hypothetical protein